MAPVARAADPKTIPIATTRTADFDFKAGKVIFIAET
jgi:hypothetical protein